MADDAHAEAVAELESAFSSAMQEFRRMYARMADSVSPGMLPATLKVLAAVHRCGSTTASALAEKLSSDKGAVSRSISELEDLGMVVRTPDASDGRIKLISLTPKGVRRFEDAKRPFDGRLALVVAGWEPDRIRLAAELIAGLAEPIEESPEPGAS